MEVAFRQHTCFIHNLDGVDLLTGSRGNNLYTLSLQDIMAVLLEVFLSSNLKKTTSVRHVQWARSTKKSHKPKSEDANQEKLYLLHMDLCGPMRVESINGKKYILVIVDDYYRFKWVKFLRSKDEAPNFIIKFLKMIQVRLKVLVHLQANSTGLSSLTTIDQDAPSPSKSHTAAETQSSVIPQYVEEDNLDIEVAHMRNDPLFGVPIPEVTSAQSSSTPEVTVKKRGSTLKSLLLRLPD
nr:hypothetical protein [Tanacetum cinerariifolium]